MTQKAKFKIGDHVRWNSEAGKVTGVIIKVHTKDFDYKGLPTMLRRMIHSMKSKATSQTI